MHIAHIQLHQTKGGEQFILPFHNFFTTKSNKKKVQGDFHLAFPQAEATRAPS